MSPRCTLTVNFGWLITGCTTDACACAVQLRWDTDTSSDPHDRVLSQLYLTHRLIPASVGTQSGTCR